MTPPAEPGTRARAALQSGLLVLCGVLLACVAGEALIRIATVNQQNYVIEMWRYARLLKARSPDPQVGHDHRPNSQARLERVDVQINALGMRGPMPDPRIPPERTVVVLGDSIALGWGVSEPETLRAQLAGALGPDMQVLNAGVGNMNLAQVVAHWSHLRTQVHAGTIVLLATPRSTEVQPPDSHNWLVENSELAALGVTYFRQATGGAMGREGLVDAYRRNWTGGAGLAGLQAAMDRLNRMEAGRGTRILVALMPEAHDMSHYRLDFMSETMRRETLRRGWEFVDLLPLLQDRPSADYWVSKQDVHPNGKALARIAARLAPLVAAKGVVPAGCAAGRGGGARDCPPAR